MAKPATSGSDDLSLSWPGLLLMAKKKKKKNKRQKKNSRKPVAPNDLILKNNKF